MCIAHTHSRRPVARGLRAACAFLLLTSFCGFAAQPATVSAYRDPVELLRQAVQNEIQSNKSNSAYFLFRSVKTTPRESTTRLYVETKDATAGLVIAYNGKLLTPEQRQAEEARVRRFVDHPEELKKKRQQEQEYDDRTLRIMRALPDAFLYDYVGEELASPGIGHAGEHLVKLSFRPNPHYEAPSRVEEVLTGMQGYVLIDPVRCRLASIDGTLFKEVGFGWGILGHLNRGGRFIVQQQEVGDNTWEISNMTLNFTGKILFFKSFAIDSKEVFSDFRKVPPDLTFAQALELLKKEEANLTADNCCQPTQP